MVDRYELVNYKEFEHIVGPTLPSLSKLDLTVFQDYQLFPNFVLKYYDDILLKYAMGSGKTLASLLAIESYIKHFYLFFNALRDDGHNIRMKADLDQRLPGKPVIVGPWSAKPAILNDLQKLDVWKTYLSKVNPGPTRDISHVMTYFIRFITHKDFAAQYTSIQDDIAKHDAVYYKALLENEASPHNQTFIANLQNNIMVIDEIQGAYAKSGLNSLGVCLRDLNRLRLTGHINCKILYLSWTPFSTSILEAWYLADIMTGGQLAELSINDYFTLTYDGPYTVHTPTKECITMLTDIFKGKISVYKPSAEERTVDMIYTGRALVPGKEETKINRVPMSEQQWEVYSSMSDDIEENTLESEQSGHKNILSYAGEFLVPEKGLSIVDHAEYSPITHELVKELFKSMQERKGKSLIFHPRIRTGVLMFIEFLKQFGFITGTRTTSETLCWRCTKRKRLCTCEEFTPARITMITGDTSVSERKRILDEFNHPDNLYGDKIGLIFSSSVGEVGISLVAVRNVFVLLFASSFKSMSQLLARAARLQSHILLPPKERNVRVSIYIPVGPNGEETRYVQLLNTKYRNEVEITKLESMIDKDSILKIIREPSKVRANFKIPKKSNSELYTRIFANLIETYGAKLLHYITKRVCSVLPYKDAVKLLAEGKIRAAPWKMSGITKTMAEKIIMSAVIKGDLYLSKSDNTEFLTNQPAQLKRDPVAVHRRYRVQRPNVEIPTERLEAILVEVLKSKRIGAASAKLIKSIKDLPGDINKNAVTLFKYDFSTKNRLRRILDAMFVTYYNGDETGTSDEYFSKRYISRASLEPLDFDESSRNVEQFQPDGFTYRNYIYTIVDGNWDMRTATFINREEIDSDLYINIRFPRLAQLFPTVMLRGRTENNKLIYRSVRSYSVATITSLYKNYFPEDTQEKYTVDYMVSKLLFKTIEENKIKSLFED